MGSRLALSVVFLLGSLFVQTSASTHFNTKVSAKLTLPGGAKPEKLSATDQQHLDLFNYVVQLTAQLDAEKAEYGVIKPLESLASTYVKLKTSELVANGFTYNEFNIPAGVTVSPPVQEVILVYNKFAQGSSPFNPADGTIVSPVVDLTCYALPSNGTSVTITPAPSNVISVNFTAEALTSADTSTVCKTAAPGASSIGEVPVATRLTGVDCAGTALGSYFVLLPPISAPTLPGPETPDSPPPVPPSQPSSSSVPGSSTTKSSSDKTPVVIGATLGVIASFALLAILLLWGYRWWHRKKIEKMEKESERGETLQTALMMGGSRAPAAGAMRTKPRLEDSVMDDAFLNKGPGR